MLPFKARLKFATKDLLSQKRLNAFFIFNLVLGFLGFLLLQVFQTSVNQQTKDKAQESLGGDLVISARRMVNDDEIKAIEAKEHFDFVKKSKSYDFFAMIKHENQTRLVLVRAVPDQYPIYGKFEVKNVDGKTQTLDHITEHTLCMDPDLVDQLKVADDFKNEKLRIGDIDIPVTGIITADPSRTFKLGALAPFVLISEKDLAATNLIRPGSTMTTSFLYQLKDPSKADVVKTQLEKDYLDATLRFSTALEEGEGGNSVFTYLLDYLGLVALISIGLCFLCLSYMLNWFFQVQKKTIAIYKILGLEEKSVLQIQVYKNLILSIISFVIALGLLQLTIPVLQVLLDKYFNVSVRLFMSPVHMILSFIIVVIGPQLIAIPTYLAAMNMNPLVLLRQELGSLRLISLRQQSFWGAGLFFTFWSLAIWQSHSWKTGSLFIGGVIAAVIIAWLFISGLRNATALIVNRLPFEYKYAFLGLIRKPGSTDLIFMTMTLSVVVLTLLPHIKKSIIEEVRPSQSSKIPSLFMFDIQSDEKDGLAKMIQEKFDRKLDLTPLVRSRILKINAVDYERVQEQGVFKTREDETEARFRNRGVNLTYKSDLQDSETLIEGEWFKGKYVEDENTVPEVSLEQKYAERVGAQIGDVMTFDIQGVEMRAKVTSLRRVRWTSFQPNFFIVFQSGVLEEAPQMYLSAVTQLDEKQIHELQNAVVDKYPNISIINVKQTVEKALVFLDEMSLALQAMATLSLVVGFFIFIILINTQVGERITEMNLLQVLGSEPPQLYRIMVKQFSLIAFLSLSVGLLLGSGISYLIMKEIFRLGIYFDYWSMLALIVILVSLTFVVLKLAMQPLRRLQPLELLKNEGGLVEG